MKNIISFSYLNIIISITMMFIFLITKILMISGYLVHSNIIQYIELFSFLIFFMLKNLEIKKILNFYRILKESASQQPMNLSLELIDELDKINLFKNSLIEAINTSHEGIAILDSDGNYIWMNEAHEAMFGYGKGELLGKSWSTIYSEEDTKWFIENVFPIIEKTGKWSGEATAISKDGVTPINEMVYLTSLENGGLICTCRNRDEYGKFIDSTTLVVKTDKYGVITYANEKFLDVCGFKYDEMIGETHNLISSGIHDKRFWKNMYNVTVKKRKIWHELVINRNKKGELFYVDTYIKAEFSSENDELIGFLSVRQDVTELYESLYEINKKNIYLEHAAKILRHDMHSGINTYIPRGVSSLERRLKKDIIEKNKLETPLKLLKEGLKHTQKIYRGVYEFTNLVKKGVVMTKESLDLKKILTDYLKTTAYSSKVKIDRLPTIDVNESLFCTAIDNLIRNGLKYNDSETKLIKIYMEDDNHIAVEDNGRGMTQEEFNNWSQPYIRKRGQKESGTGLGLNICIAILKEHNFSITCTKNNNGTKLLIKIK